MDLQDDSCTTLKVLDSIRSVETHSVRIQEIFAPYDRASFERSLLKFQLEMLQSFGCLYLPAMHRVFTTLACKMSVVSAGVSSNTASVAQVEKLQWTCQRRWVRWFAYRHQTFQLKHSSAILQ